MIAAMISGAGGMVWTLAMFVVALGIIVTIHEFGHYIVGRWSGIHAEAFSIGFGPVLVSRRDRHGTVWQIAALPLGGYVRFLGDADAASAGPARAVDPGHARRTLDGAPLWARVATVSAGPLFNFVLAALVFAGLFLWQGLPADNVTVGRILATPPGVENRLQPGDEVLAIDGQPITGWADLAAVPATGGPQAWQVRRDGNQMRLDGPPLQPALVQGVAPRSPAAAAGLRAGDVITAIEGEPVTGFAEVIAAVTAAGDQPLAMTLWREGRGEVTTTLAARPQDVPLPGGGFETRWLIGVTGGGNYFLPAMRPVGLGEALGWGVRDTWGIIAASVSGVRAMVTGEISRCNLGGAISIAESTGQIAEQGLVPFIRWIAILSAAIGFLNLLPIPVLDGGHLAFYAWEALTGRPPPDTARRWLTMIGLVLVIALMIFGLTNDISCP